MPIEYIGLIVVIAVLVLMFLRVPIAVAMSVPPIVAILYLKGMKTAQVALDNIIWGQMFSYSLSTIPLFVLMGQFLYTSGISHELYETFRNWLGRMRGGLGLATIAASAMFGASSGSSLASTGTIGVIATKEMLKTGYSQALTGGSIVAGGTLGILIPPSTTLVIYGMLTETSIGKLLMAGIIPGIILTLLFMITIYIAVLIKPSLAPKADVQVSWKEKFVSLKSNVWVLVLFFIVIGGIYAGIFNVTEAAGVGALGAFLITVIRGRFNFREFMDSLLGTIKMTGFLFAIVVSAFILNYVLVLTRLPTLLTNTLAAADLSPTMVFVLIIVMYIILGAIMDTLGMMVVTVPILLPILDMLNFDLIWFGIIMVLVVEMALISPPVGMNCFVLKGVAPELPIEKIFAGALIFLIPILLLIVMLYIFPEIVLFLPDRTQ